MADERVLPPLTGVGIPVLARSAHDRAAHRRTDEQWLDQAWRDPASRVLLLSADSRAAVDAEGRLILRAPGEVGLDGDRILLGEFDGLAYFAVLAHAGGPTAEPAGDWRGLRELGVALPDLDVGLLTAATALHSWHQTHTHCPRCGAITEISQAGWSRRCPQDGSQHFPRTDPAVIMLVRDEQDRCLLARSPLWPPGRRSVLAGFVEAGESAEAAVVREVAEEVGIRVHRVRYVASQPHPFPASLMLGFTAEVDGSPALTPDEDEIVDAGWFTRAQVRAAADWGSEVPGPGTELRALPPAMSIARQLIETWLAEESSS
ncbi:NAD(+) diphosphatase [Jatrophihabitans telluris]|uniref:NAD(+) diphosphatase n=1 Tax=Jatrophihabitans telluris TaxID=2038343 RepID=A0ABY4R1W4_9ACTN|nr:NAD(+) diphosphatase [Jatrophihabitans telluris]UQX89725.1 NAD(+) diphosphatase [Jatrophihabitans telluris]